MIIEVLKGILVLLIIIVFNLFIFIFINPNNTLTIYLIVSLLVVLAVLFFIWKVNLYYKLIPIITLILLSGLISAHNVLEKITNDNNLEPVDKYELLMNSFANTFNNIYAKTTFKKYETKDFIIYYQEDLREEALTLVELQSYISNIKKEFFRGEEYNKIDIILFNEKNSFFKV